VIAAFPEHDAWLARGGPIRVRLARPEDRAGLRDMHERLSLRSIQLRYFTAAINIERTLERLLRPSDDSHATLVATMGDQIVAMAVYERLADDMSAEVAFLVDDAHHGLGIATLLLAELATIARSRGVRRFVAVTLPSNTAMLRVFTDCGFRYSLAPDEDGLVVTIPLDDDPRPTDPRAGMQVVLDPPVTRARVSRRRISS